MKLFNSDGSSITDQVDEDLLLTTTLSVRIDPTNASTSNTSLCDDSVCSAKGYDCCLNGDCANDGEKARCARAHTIFSIKKLILPLTHLTSPSILKFITSVLTLLENK